jgi:hypothetical protein
MFHRSRVGFPLFACWPGSCKLAIASHGYYTTTNKTRRYIDSEVRRSPGVDNSETALVAASTSSLVLNEYSRETNSRNSEISIYFQNVNRMRSKTGDLFEVVISSDFDVVVLLETSLSSYFHDKEIFDSRYFVFRRDRNPSLKEKIGNIYQLFTNCIC